MSNLAVLSLGSVISSGIATMSDADMTRQHYTQDIGANRKGFLGIEDPTTIVTVTPTATVTLGQPGSAMTFEQNIATITVTNLVASTIMDTATEPCTSPAPVVSSSFASTHAVAPTITTASHGHDDNNNSEWAGLGIGEEPPHNDAGRAALISMSGWACSMMLLGTVYLLV